MSSPINKVISNLPQAFTTAEQAQARANIGAQASLAFAYSGSTITSIDGSAVGTPGAFTAVHHDSNLSGSATSGSPLGLHSAMVMDMSNHPFGEHGGSAFIGQHTYLYPNYLTSRTYGLAPVFGIMESNSAASVHNSTAFIIAHTANGVGTNVTTSIYGGNGWDLSYSNEDNYIHEVKLTNSGNHYKYNGDTAKQAIYGFGSALFTDNTGTTWETVDASSIRRWNANSAAPVVRWEQVTQGGTSYYTADQLTISLDFNKVVMHNTDTSMGNTELGYLAPTVTPSNKERMLYMPPQGDVPRWADIEPSPYQIKVYKPTTASIYLHTSDYPKFPNTADGTFVIVNLGDGPLVTYPDSLGATASVGQNQSAQLIWDSQSNRWVHWNN